MNGILSPESLRQLPEISTGALILLKITALLAAAWLIHWALRGRNPRWRALLWRAAVVGLVVVSTLTVLPPLYVVVVERAVPVGEDMSQLSGTADRLPAPKPTASGEDAVVTAAAPDEARFSELPTARGPGGISPMGTSLPPGDSAQSSDRAGGEGGTLRDRRPQEGSQDPQRYSALPPRGERAIMPYALLAVWLMGACVLGLRLVGGVVRIRRVIRRASPVPDWIEHEQRRIAGSLACRGRIHVCQSREITTPCLFGGLTKSVLLLPERICDQSRREDLVVALAHELAHVRTRDLLWNSAIHVVATCLWFHPLVWRIRLAHLRACEAVCDAVAADLLGNAGAYGRSLARLALEVGAPQPAGGLAMARAADVTRRLRALKRRGFSAPLGRRSVAIGLLAAAVAVALLGGLGLTYVEATTEPLAARHDADEASQSGGRQTSKPSDDPAQDSFRSLVLRVLAAEDDSPLEDVEIKIRGQIGGNRFAETLQTNEQGLATCRFTSRGPVDRLMVTARKAKRVPQLIGWDSRHGPVRLPPFEVLRLQPGRTISGVVRDEAGRPIPGADVMLSGRAENDSDISHYGFTLKRLKTDDEGRWSCDVAPSDLGGVSLDVFHPDYLHVGAPAVWPSELVLKKGLTVTGRVLDEQGQPIAGASAALGSDRFGTSDPKTTADPSGRFELRNCKPGRTIVTVQAEGCAPEFQPVVVGRDVEPLEFRLGPGATIRGRLVDVRGRPVQGAFCAADTWRGHRSLEFRVDSDAEGRFRWTSAPHDTVLFDFGKRGYMSVRKRPLKTSETEHVVQLHPELSIEGTVTDASTGEPIPSFSIMRGYNLQGRSEVYWARHEAKQFSGGRYRYKLGEPSAGHYLRVEAPGYAPADSREFGSTEGAQTFDFKLTGADGPSGIVLRPDGAPAEGAQVLLGTREHTVILSSGYFHGRGLTEHATTDADGRFSFHPQTGPFLAMVLHDTGYAEIASSELRKAVKVTLKPWGRIEGTLMIGDRPGADQPVVFEPTREKLVRGVSVFSYGYETTTDEQGRFVFDRVVPGGGIMSRVVIVRWETARTHYRSHHVHVEVRPGETATVQIGGTGRPVTGRILLPDTIRSDFHWAENEAGKIAPRDPQRAGPYVPYVFIVGRDGSFRADDVPAGRYGLVLPINAPPDPQRHGPGSKIGQATFEFTVPEIPGGRSDEPLDLGGIRARLFWDPRGWLGPAGEIIARDLESGKLKEAIARALEDESAFQPDAVSASGAPSEFPVTRFSEDGGKAAGGAGDVAVVVLDNCDPNFRGDGPFGDGLRLLSADAKEAHALGGLNNAETVGAMHKIALDRVRGRIYAAENVGDRILAVTSQGTRLFQVEDVGARALAVDPKTGNLWCLVGSTLDQGETIVLDPEGRFVTTFAVHGIDIAYDEHTDAFWIVGYGIVKVDRDGKVLFRKPPSGWACVSVAPDPRDGAAWITERDHPDVADSANRLWRLDAGGNVVQRIDLGQRDPFCVACDPKTGVAWVSNRLESILRFTPDGKELPPLPIPARAIGIGQQGGPVWVTTENEVLRLDQAGKPTARYAFGKPSSQSWLAAFY